MFWDSVLAGLSVMLRWQPYVAMLPPLAISYIPVLVCRIAGIPSTNGPILAMSIVNAMNQAVTTYVFFALITPFLLHLQPGIAWALPWQLIVSQPLAIALLLAFATVIAWGAQKARLAMLLTTSAGLPVFAWLASRFAQSGELPIDIWPGVLFLVGDAAVALVVMFVIGSLLGGAFDSRGPKFAHRCNQVFAPVTGVLLLTPVFIYAGWLAQQVPQ